MQNRRIYEAKSLRTVTSVESVIDVSAFVWVVYMHPRPIRYRGNEWDWPSRRNRTLSFNYLLLAGVANISMFLSFLSISYWRGIGGERMRAKVRGTDSLNMHPIKRQLTNH